MAKKNALLDILQGKTQPTQAASSNSGGGGRSISSQNDAFKQALDEQPSTYNQWNPITEDEQKPKKKNFLGITIPDGSENPWDYDATNNVLNTSVPAKPKDEKKAPASNGIISAINENQNAYKDPNAGKSMAGSSYSQALADNKQEPDNNIFRQDIGDKPKPKKSKSGTSHNKQPVSETDEPKPWEMEVDSPDSQPEQKTGFLEWIKNVGKAAAEGTASSIAGAERALYQAGQGGRTAQYEEERAQLERDLDRALRSYQYDKEDGMSESDLQADLNVIEDIQRRLDAYNKVLNENVQEEATKATSELSNALQEQSSRHTEFAKAAAGDSFLGNLATDVTINALQMAGDAAMNLVAPGTSLAAMGFRTGGSAAQEAEAEGATLLQQLGYGAVKGGIEVASEMMFDGLAGIYGKGGADDIIEEVIRKMTKSGNEAGRTALRVMFGGLGEALEEGVSGVADPFAKMIYQGVASLPENFNKEMAAETLYSMLVGFAMGGGMTTVDIGGNKSANADLAATDAVQTQLEAEGFSPEAAQIAAPIINKANSGEQISTKERNALLEIIRNEDVRAGSNETAPAITPTDTTAAGRTEVVGTAPAVTAAPEAENPASRIAKQSQLETILDTAEQNQTAPTVPQTSPQTEPAVMNPTEAAQVQTEAETAEENPIIQQIAAHNAAIEQLQTMPESEGRNNAILEHLEEINRLESEANQLVRNPEAAAEGVAPETAPAEAPAPAAEIATERAEAAPAPAMPASQPAAANPTGDARTARGAKSAPNPTPETHIDNRTPENVASRKVNAFQWDVPEIKPFFKRAAALLRRDLANSQESHTTKKAGGGNNSRVTNPLLNKVFSLFNTTQDAIDACESIIFDRGRENFADPKRIELILDEMLTNGYIPRDASLPRLNPDANYAALKGDLEGGTPYENDARARAIKNILESDFDGTMTEEDAAAEADRNFENTGYYDPMTRDGETVLDTEDTSETTLEEIDEADTAEVEEKYGKTESAEESAENASESQEEAEGTETPAESSEELNSNLEQNTEENAETEAETTETAEETPEEAERRAQIEQEIAQHEQAIEQLQQMPQSPGRDAAITEHQQAIKLLNPEYSGTAGTTGTIAETNTGSWVPPVGKPGKAAPKVSKTSINSMRNTAEMNGGTQEAIYYMPKSEKESLANAMARADADMVGEMESLMNKETWTGEDSDTAYTIYGRLMFDAVRTRDRAAVDSWAKVVQQHKTETARALQSTAKWARTGAAAAMAASSDIDANNTLTPEQKTELKNQVYEVAQTFDNIESGDVDSVRRLILKLNEIRNTGTFGAKNFEKILNKIKDYDYLKEFALRQIMAVPNDATNQADIGQQLKTWQVSSQLTRLGTFFRNFFGNATFGTVDTFAQDFLGFALDYAISKKTGRSEVGFDKGWLSKNARQAATDALSKSILEVAADVDMSGNASKYGNTSNRTNKMTGGAFERFMSRWEQLLAYSLNTSDRFFRGQMEASYAEGLNNADSNELAKAIADYRLFQNQGVAAGLSKGAHDLLNLVGVGGEITNVKNGRQGGFGLGDLINPYPGVPANLAVKALEYSPANIVKGGIEIVKLLKDAKAGKQVTGQQMQAVMDVARGITGTPIIMLFTALAKTKLFRNSDDEEDYDVAAENVAQGLSGVQWNLDATLRALQGKKAEWRDGDQLMKVSWLEPLNAFMSIASMIADENDDATLDTYISDYLYGALTAAMDLPVMENIQNVVNTIKYADGDNIWQTGGQALAQLLGDAAGGMIPAPISQTARVTDDFVRDTKGDTKAETALNALLNSIPGLRNQLPVKTDNFGNERLNEPNELLRALNSFVLPGAINTFQETEVQKEISRLYEASGDVALYPDRNAPKSLTFGKETFDLSADEQRAYHELAGNKAESYVKGLMDSRYYMTLDDEQKAAAIKEAYSAAKDLAKANYAKENGISYDSNYQKLLKGVDKPGKSDDRTALNESNLPAYIAFTTGFEDSVKSGDYKTIDRYMKNYSSLGKNLQKVITERSDDFRAIKKFSDIGVGSKSYYSYQKALANTQADLDKNGTASGNSKLMALASANIPESEKKKIITGLKKSDGNYDFGSNAVAAYKVLSNYGMDTKAVSDFFNTAMTCKTNKSSGDAADQNGVLRPDTVAYALSKMKGLTDSERSKIYNKIKSEVSNYYNDWKNYSYNSEINFINNNRYYSYSGGSSGGNSSKQNELLKILGG